MTKRVLKGDYLNKIYEKNLDTGNFIIPVSLDKYNDIFNDWDSAPFKKRDIDPDLARFLEDCADDIPVKYGIDVVFHVSNQQKDETREQMLVSIFRTYYSFYYVGQMKVLKRSYRSIAQYVITAFVFLTFIYMSRNFERERVFLSTILMSGIEIGAWVFLWEAISFFFKKGDITDKIKKYKRFSECNIFFKYEKR
jgi:hypothetical protein